MKDQIKKIKRFLTPSTHKSLTVEAKDATFKLLLDSLEVGILRFTRDKWFFNYSEDFKSTQGIKTLAAFPDINKEYVSEELWPFFSARIPSLSRERVKKVILEEEIHENDLLALLNRFGKKTITNPFELVSTREGL